MYASMQQNPKPLYAIVLTGPSDRLNNTPRKCQGWKTPAEVFREKMMEEMRRPPYPETNRSSSSRSAHTMIRSQWPASLQRLK